MVAHNRTSGQPLLSHICLYGRVFGWRGRRPWAIRTWIRDSAESVETRNDSNQIPSRLPGEVCRKILVESSGNLFQSAVKIDIQRGNYRGNLLTLHRFGLGIEM